MALATTGLPARAFASPWRYLVLGGLFAIYFVTMFEALTGKLPFNGPDVTAVLRRIIREDAPRAQLYAPQLCDGMSGLIAKLLNRNPSGRHPSARALMRALDPWLQQRVRTERALVATLQVAPETSSIRPTARHEMVAA